MDRFVVAGALLAWALGAPLSSPASAQSAPAVASAERWAAWHGCWRDVEDSSGSGVRVCVSPAEGIGATWSTILGAQRLSEETRRPDGVGRPIVDGTCRGTESTRWSTEGQRLYRDATVTCGNEPTRRLASVAYLYAGPLLIDVQTVEEGGQISVRTRRFRLATTQALADGTRVTPADPVLTRAAVSRPWTVGDVIEASSLLPADGVQAAIMQGPTAFSLTKHTLATMAGAKVSEPVIDLMVATVYPKHFEVDSVGGGGTGGFGSLLDTGMLDPFYSPILGPASLLYNCYNALGWATNSYWANCNRFDPRFSNNNLGLAGQYADPWLGGWFVTSAPGGVVAERQAEGRVVNGRGYTQVRPVDTTASGVADGGGMSGSSAGNSGSSGGSSSGASSGGYSGGGGMSGGGGDRMAVPRPPGL